MQLSCCIAFAALITMCLMVWCPLQDCDMIVHPSFLQLTVGHFYDSQTSGWELKPKASFLQTPQDFCECHAGHKDTRGSLAV
jgi:hypothetical protein